MLPQLQGEVELDLAQHGLITDLDRALDTRTWHYIRSAIQRLLDSDDESWLKKEVTSVRSIQRRRDRIPHPDGRRGGIQA
ncbi:hypothetical protein QMG61_05235 [Cryobacterium sp. PH31-AA6]|uniref:hypothetical protein n=1 Tax=Cryobacterium sp. PH31-AA6 TaxID=3046205 RepID=UPI0024BB0480|nr:hypothetical protein [Cryobacterium sp. PH31-AA6]MDJ0323166.1 hypothetical protein [Cryobacterium sp. PH31-AA6]